MRRVKITVSNNTGKVLRLKPEMSKPLHGKFAIDPPLTIEESGSWTCTSQSNGGPGPKGTITYETDGGKIEIEFYYNHPIGNALSTYYITGAPSGVIEYTIRGDLKALDQDISIELHPIT
ncbi:hypothetical protein [Mucilaginibacter rubeus]|uniref:Uncharacterized protein n=1 Tax=Mucilaginibacter rubeus TaxID=2027860 RepID=A0A5C1I4Y8_9SPHI|nr:hypothetical protein [Mucilaginibacter rubeus]QEM13023.1 hypothetical protein DEO27_024435 [Mucilaginibacter rubeus]